MSFGLYSKYYDLLYQDKDYLSEVEYVESLIQKYSTIETKSILDLGCGTGNHDFLLAGKGYEVTGVDLSEEMISIANEKLKMKNEKLNLEFHCNDIRTFDLHKKFDCIISLFHVASYQTANDDLNRFFETASKHLKPDGLFIFDFWYGQAVLTDLPVVRIKRLENNEIKITRIAEPVIHYDKNVVDVNYEILIEDKYNQVFERINEIHRMRYLFIPEMIDCGKQFNLSYLTTFEWITYHKISMNNWNGLILFKK